MYFEVTLYFCLDAPDHQTYFHHFIVNTEVIISACLYTIFQIHIHLKLSNYFNQIYGVVVGVIASSVVDRQVKLKTIRLIFLFLAKTGWLGIRIMCRSGATCQPTDLFQ